MIRPLRIAALLLVPIVVPAAALAGCSHSDPSSTGASASAETATDDPVVGTPEPTTVPTVDTTPVPTSPRPRWTPAT